MASARASHAEPNSVGQGQPSGNGPAQLLGGRTAWIVLTVGQFAAIVAVLQRSSLGVAATAALDRFGITAADLRAWARHVLCAPRCFVRRVLDAGRRWRGKGDGKVAPPPRRRRPF